MPSRRRPQRRPCRRACGCNAPAPPRCRWPGSRRWPTTARLSAGTNWSGRGGGAQRGCQLAPGARPTRAQQPRRRWAQACRLGQRAVHSQKLPAHSAGRAPGLPPSRPPPACTLPASLSPSLTRLPLPADSSPGGGHPLPAARACWERGGVGTLERAPGGRHRARRARRARRSHCQGGWHYRAGRLGGPRGQRGTHQCVRAGGGACDGRRRLCAGCHRQRGCPVCARATAGGKLRVPPACARRKRR